MYYISLRRMKRLRICKIPNRGPCDRHLKTKLVCTYYFSSLKRTLITLSFLCLLDGYIQRTMLSAGLLSWGLDAVTWHDVLTTIWRMFTERSTCECNRPYSLFTFDPMASFPCLPVLARQACAWRLHLMFPARICCFVILSPITNLSLNVLCTKHDDWCHTKTRLLGQKWINGKVYWCEIHANCDLRGLVENMRILRRVFDIQGKSIWPLIHTFSFKILVHH